MLCRRTVQRAVDTARFVQHHNPCPLDFRWSCTGDAEVFLVIERGPREARFLSAPLHEPIELGGVTRVQLVILAETGPIGVTYHALFNAHCVFDTDMDV